ncbi:hypothetical protein TNCV_5038831 [Trichonephila clavipes]|nr:hypothetical protein TNCV_5038831 [Trichonephila clavipes]
MAAFCTNCTRVLNLKYPQIAENLNHVFFSYATYVVVVANAICLSTQGVAEFDRQIQRDENRQHGDDESPWNVESQTMFSQSAVVVFVANAISLMQSVRGPRNSSWQRARSTPVVGLDLAYQTVTVRIC